ncbi:DUF3048 domain-containing protein [Brevibacillus sp. SYSU BS000544]|uniref:DUF3048 domain-containing protein n=1 Tax=Brevibacillus sp. SYSU BS000544 TaxID=3416443 RepID=UPI003CE49B7C
MLKRIQQILPSVLLSTMLVACSQEVVTQPVQPNVTPPEQPVTIHEPVPTVKPYTAPFTGIGTDQKIENRPIMVMVNNHPYARPQSGLDKADIVYEILAEGEVTRFVAIYQSQRPEVIGPVRSIRPYYIQVGAGFDAVMAHVGGSEDALETLARSDYSAINEISNGKYFWREKFRKAPHNVYTDLGRIEQAMKDKGMRDRSELPYFPFLPADSQITQGEVANTVDVTFHSLYKASYRYDSASKKYLRFTQGKPHIDLTTSEQLATTNLIVIASKHQVLDKEGRRAVDVVGPGDGYLFQQGKARKVKWKRSGGVIRVYTDASYAEELPLLPGNTWINIIPTAPGLTKGLIYK